ncbi:MAG TPA: DNA polymerase III subunit alpha, partial [Mangrovimonas sp.]|nr:DNA polymerase III subunit alpha [Mangrovimonas sp.]
HYPAEYMAAVLSNNMNDIKQVTFFMEECRRMKLNVLGPDVNESYYKFSVNKDNAVRFGMGAIKGVGHGAVQTIVEHRKKDGPYKSIFDMAKRIDLRAANKKAFENLAFAGSFDCFKGTHRAQYFHDEGDGITFLEKAIRYGAKHQENSNSAQVSLFGDASEVQIAEPQVPPCDEWGTMEKLAREKEVVGIYISGHPLDDFKIEMDTFCTATLEVFSNMHQIINREVTFSGVVTDVQHRVSKNGKGWASFFVEDYTTSHEFRIFGEDYLKFRHFLVKNSFVYVQAYIREGWKNKETGQAGEPRLQFNNFMLLQDVMEARAKKLSVKMELSQLKEETVQQLEDLFEMHKGNQALNFIVYDVEEKINLQMPSRSQKVKISQELLNEIKGFELDYKLN